MECRYEYVREEKMTQKAFFLLLLLSCSCMSDWWIIFVLLVFTSLDALHDRLLREDSTTVGRGHNCKYTFRQLYATQLLDINLFGMIPDQ